MFVKLRSFIWVIILLWAIIGSVGWYMTSERCKDNFSKEPTVITKYIDRPVPTSVTPVVPDTTPVNTPWKPSKVFRKITTPISKIFKDPTMHKVKKGENLYRIGLAHPVEKDGVSYPISWPQLMKWNNMKTPDISVGQKIFIGDDKMRQAYADSMQVQYSDPTLCDSVRTYEIPFNKKNVSGMMFVTTRGVLIDGFIEVESEPIGFERPKNSLWLGASTGIDSTAFSVSADYMIKDKFAITGRRNFLTGGPKWEAGAKIRIGKSK